MWSRGRDAAPEPALEGMASVEPRADVLLERGETAAVVRAAVAALPERQRMAVVLARFEGLSCEAPDDWVRIEAKVEARRRWTLPWLERWVPSGLRRAAAGVVAAVIVLGATGGALLSRAALAPSRTPSVEALAFAETFGDLPWGSPAAGLARPLLAAMPASEAR